MFGVRSRSSEYLKNPGYYPDDPYEMHAARPWLYTRHGRLRWRWRIAVIVGILIGVPIAALLLVNLVTVMAMPAALWGELPGRADPVWHAPLIWLGGFAQ